MRRAIGLLLIPALAACGKDAIDPVTGGEGSGATGFDVFVTDDPPGTGASDISAELSGSIRVALRNDAGTLVTLGLMQGLDLLLQQDQDTLRLTDMSRPPTGDYNAIELRFEGVDVVVDAGSEVGDSTLASNVVLELGAGSPATVEVDLQTFSVDNDSEIDIVIDLNSEDWITRANIEDGAVTQADLANSVSVEVD